MRVSDAMTRNVRVCNLETSLRDCAQVMNAGDVGAIPVQTQDRLVGMITDRDMAIRAVAAGKGPETPVREIMSREVLYCFDDQDLEHIVESMGAARVRRVPVIDRGNRLVGILSIGDVALKHAPEVAARAVGSLSKRGGPHSQSTDDGD